MKLGDFQEGARVRLVDQALEAEGTECKGTVVELVVKEVRVRFDDGETHPFFPDDDSFVPIESDPPDSEPELQIDPNSSKDLERAEKCTCEPAERPFPDSPDCDSPRTDPNCPVHGRCPTCGSDDPAIRLVINADEYGDSFRTTCTAPWHSLSLHTGSVVEDTGS